MYQWSAADMAVVLELALQKDGDTKENVLLSLKSLSEKKYRHQDESLPQALKWLAEQPDPVAATRRVVDNYTRIMEEQFETPVELEAEVA